MTISNTQARSFALSIDSDIAKYIKEHQAEYEDFLKQEQQKAGDMQCKAIC